MAIVINGSTGITDVDGGEVLSTADYDTISGVLDKDNRIINGDFGVWQRGTSFTTGVYGADRWLTSGTGANISQTRQSFTLGDTLGVNSPTYFLRAATSGQTLATQYAVTTQRIESVRSYAGQTITVLGWARRASGLGNMVVESAQHFGTGGSPSAAVISISPTTVALTTSWEPFAVVMNIPSIAGKTLGPNSNDYLALNFWISAGTDYIARAPGLGLQTIGVDLWGIHIKYGIHTADEVNLYRPRDATTELALCQRYYQVISLVRQNGITYTANGDTRSRFGFIQATRTASPVLTVQGSANVIASGSAGDTINIGLGTISLSAAGSTGGAIYAISNFAAFTACGGVFNWGDNGGGALTVLVDAEI